MTTRKLPTKCADCGGHLTDVAIVDRDESGRRQPLSYRVPDQQPGFWRSLFPKLGKVTSLMCADCGRISLYARPENEEGNG